MSMKSAFRKLSRGFEAKDRATFDEGLEELEEHMEKDEAKEDPDTIEVHNHIPDSRDTLGELPGKDPAHTGTSDEEEPPWFKKHREANDAVMKKLGDDIGALQKWAKEEKGEPEHQEDRHDEDPIEEHADPDPNLEMDRHRDRRDDDRRHDDRMHDRRDRRDGDEANKEILGELEFEAPPGTGDRARKAKDSAFLEDAFQDTLAKAEVLAPGIRLPTFDVKALPTKTFRAIDILRKTALDLAYNKADTRGVIDQAMSGRALDSKVMSMGARRVLFNAAASQIGDGNNQRATDRSGSFEAGGGLKPKAGIQSLSDLNRVNREKYARK